MPRSRTIISKAFFKGAAKAQSGERAGVLVVDEHTPGVYDTVYVDLNYDFDFRNDTPARLTRDFTSQEAACLDYDRDGLNDISGGLVYFVSDGTNAVPTQDWLWGIPGSFYGNGDLVAFHVQDFVEGSDHGQGTTSVATGQGVVAGNVFFGPGGPPVAGGRGLVVGPGKDVRSTQNGDFYISPFIEDPFIFASPRLRRQLRAPATTSRSSATRGHSPMLTTTESTSSQPPDRCSSMSRSGPTRPRSSPMATAARASARSFPASPATGIGVGAADLNDTLRRSSSPTSSSPRSSVAM